MLYHQWIYSILSFLVAETCLQLQKCLRPRWHSPKKEHLRCQAINLAPPRRVRAWGDSPLRLKDAGLGASQPTASRTRPGQICVSTNMADGNVSQLLLGESLSKSKIGLISIMEEEFIIV